MSNKLFIATLVTSTFVTSFLLAVPSSQSQTSVGITGNSLAAGVSPGTTSASAGNTSTANSSFGLNIAGSGSSSFATPDAAGANTSGSATTGNGLTGMGRSSANVLVTPGGTFSNSTANANNNGFGSSEAITKSDGIYSNGLGYGVTSASGSFNTTGIGF